MASTYTDNNGIEKPGDGEQSGTWGQTVNVNMDLLDEALEGQVTETLPAAGSTGTPNAFAIADGSTSAARHRFVTFADAGDLGATAYVQLAPNDAEKIYFVKNSLSGSRNLTLFQGTYNAGRAVEVANGDTVLVAFDGGGATATCTQIGEIPLATGSIVSQDSDDVSITGGSVTGVTFGSASVTVTGGSITGTSISGLPSDLAITDGGTGASTASAARSNLGLAIGTNVQGWDTNLDQIAALTPTSNNFIVGNGSAWAKETPTQALSSLGVTATAAELNALDGVTATAGEINTLDGITGRSGSDTTLLTGTAGTSGNVAAWDANGDVVDGGLPQLSLVGYVIVQSADGATEARVDNGVNGSFDDDLYSQYIVYITNFQFNPTQPTPQPRVRFRLRGSDDTWGGAGTLNWIASEASYINNTSTASSAIDGGVGSYAYLDATAKARGTGGGRGNSYQINITTSRGFDAVLLPSADLHLIQGTFTGSLGSQDPASSSAVSTIVNGTFRDGGDNFSEKLVGIEISPDSGGIYTVEMYVYGVRRPAGVPIGTP